MLIVFALTFLVLILFQPLLKKYGPQPPAEQAQKPSLSSQPAAAVAKAPSAASEPAPPTPPPVVAQQASAESETVIENDLYRVTFTNRGARVKSWILKKYKNNGQNQLLDLVNLQTSPGLGYPLSLYTYDETLRHRLNSVLYVASSPGQVSAPAQVSFEYADQDLVVRKAFRFTPTYVLSVETAVFYKGSEIFAPPAWPAGFGDQETAASYAPSRIDYHSDISTDRTALFFPNYILRLPIKRVSGGDTVKGPFEWAGTDDQYFTAIFIPDDPATAGMITLRNLMQAQQRPGENGTSKIEVLGVAVGSLRGPTRERVYVGPKEIAALDAVPVPTIRNDNPDLRGIVDFGWWGLLARPLFLWLKWTYNHVYPNWGWAIVIQTFIITAALLPLRIAQMKSMLKMQRVAPQIKSIQEKYKKYSLRDPRKAAMNEEISALYKKEGVNPAGGCLPLLVQLPFLYAYYRMLAVAIDLRQAHWLWIADLSARDPYFLLPILMVVSMFAMQRMTPQAGMDPQQQKMMNWMMPLFMGFIFFNLQAGLNLYYGETNLISIAQQAVMNRTKLGREMREMMEKRARKKEK